MKDFDKKMAKRLDEEAEFPQMRKNWERLSGRLDAYDTGMSSGRSQQHFWQIMTIVLAFISLLLVWKIYDLQRERTHLEQTISKFQQNGPSAASPLPDTGTATTSAHIAARQPNGAEPASLARTPEAGAFRNGRSAAPRLAEVPNAPAAPLFENSPARSNSGPETASRAQDTLNTAVPQTGASASRNTLAPLPLHVCRTLSAPCRIVFSPTFASIPAPPIIRPHRGPAHFRAGVQAVTGKALTDAEGISWLTGAGFALAYSPKSNFWLTLSADWLRYSISTNDYLPSSLYPEDPPKANKPHKKLTHIEAYPRQQRLDLGVQYVLPLKFRLRPVFQFGHSWIRREYGFYEYKFEEKHHGPGGPKPNHTEYKVEKPATVWVGNNWRFGAGLEYETANWVLGLSAGYSKNFSAGDPMFSAILGRMTLQYAF